MKRLIFALILTACFVANAQNQQTRIEQHVKYLAADSLRGRQAGSADARKAADYIEREFEQMGLQPLDGNYKHYFVLFGNAGKPITEDDFGTYARQTIYRNVAGVIEGSDPILKNEYIVVGGHYDHLGVKNGEVYNGADDNASGTATVIEVARALLARRGELSRSVIVCAFDAEEIGLYGSKALSAELIASKKIGQVKMMMSIDMVGWLKQGKSLDLTGTGTLKNCNELLSEVAKASRLNITTHSFEQSIFTATDTEPFASHGVPTLAVTTGLKSPYHKPEDDAELIDYDGMNVIADFITNLTVKMAQGQQRMEPTGRLAPKHANKRKPFEWGLNVGYDMSNMNFTNTMFNCKSQMGLMTGISTNWNFSKYLGLQTDVLYELARAPYPNADDIFGEPDGMRQQSVVVPMQLRVMLGDPSQSLNIGFGGFYGYRFAGKLNLAGSGVESLDNQHQYGLVWSIEERLANLSLDFTFYYQMQECVAQHGIVPAGTKNAFTFTLGWYF